MKIPSSTTETSVRQNYALHIPRALILIALIIINSLAISGQLGSMGHMALCGTNMGLAIGESLLAYRTYASDNSFLRSKKIVYLISSVILVGLFNGLGMGAVGPFASMATVGIAQLVTTLVLTVTLARVLYKTSEVTAEYIRSLAATATPAALQPSATAGAL